MHPLLQTSSALPFLKIPQDSTHIDSMVSREPVLQTLKKMDLQEFNLTEIMHGWLNSAIDLGIRVILAIAIFFIGRLVIKGCLKLLSRTLLRRKTDSGVNGFLRSVIYALLVLSLIGIIINILGIKAVSFAALLASAGVAVGMALSGQLQNFAGGAILLFTQPFKIGNFIQSQNVEGTVGRIGMFHTTIFTVDNKKIYIPNSILTTDVVINFSEQNLRRCSWKFSIEYDEDIKRVRKILLQLLEQEQRALKQPEPIVVVNEFAESAIVIMVRAWVKNELYWDLFWDFNEKVHEAFTQAGINFPYPQLTLSQRGASQAAKEQENKDNK